MTKKIKKNTAGIAVLLIFLILNGTRLSMGISFFLRFRLDFYAQGLLRFSFAGEGWMMLMFLIRWVAAVGLQFSRRSVKVFLPINRGCFREH